MVLAVLPMVELLGVAEGVHDGLEDRFQNLGIAIYTKSIHKKIQEAKGVKQTSFTPPPPYERTTDRRTTDQPINSGFIKCNTSNKSTGL